jgi:hypothetical protein
MIDHGRASADRGSYFYDLARQAELSRLGRYSLLHHLNHPNRLLEMFTYGYLSFWHHQSAVLKNNSNPFLIVVLIKSYYCEEKIPLHSFKYQLIDIRLEK